MDTRHLERLVAGERREDPGQPAREHRLARAWRPGEEQVVPARGGEAGHALEERNRSQLYEIAKKQGIPGRSKMGKWDLIDAIRKAR